jgi:hypothetical protein
VVNEAIDTLQIQFPALQKVVAYSAKRRTQITAMSNCTQILLVHTAPRPDLLYQWMEPVCTYNAEWNIAWLPQKENDRWAWVQVMNVRNNNDALGEVDAEVKREIVGFVKSKGADVLSFWSFSGKIGLILHTASQAQYMFE